MHDTEVPAPGGAGAPPDCLFVGGAQRSGTTLLQRLLCQDPRANPMLGEAKYLRNLLAAYRQACLNFEAETCFYFPDRDALRLFHVGIVEQLLARTRSLYPGTGALVLKEPHLTLYFPELAELLARARFLLIVRDPRDAVASMIRVGERLAAGGADDVFVRLFAGRDMAALGRHYLSFYMPALSAAALAGRLLLLRYEDLVADPGAVVARAAAFAGLDAHAIDPARRDEGEALEARRQSPYKRAWLTDLDAAPVSAERIGAYRGVLSEQEARALGTACAAFMERFGYRRA